MTVLSQPFFSSETDLRWRVSTRPGTTSTTATGARATITLSSPPSAPTEGMREERILIIILYFTAQPCLSVRRPAEADDHDGDYWPRRPSLQQSQVAIEFSLASSHVLPLQPSRQDDVGDGGGPPGEPSQGGLRVPRPLRQSRLLPPRQHRHPRDREVRHSAVWQRLKKLN